jgi:hypothetical protein
VAKPAGWFYVRVLRRALFDTCRTVFTPQGIFGGAMFGLAVLGLTYILTDEAKRPDLNAGTAVIAFLIVGAAWFAVVALWSLAWAPVNIYREAVADAQKAPGDFKLVSEVNGEYVDLKVTNDGPSAEFEARVVAVEPAVAGSHPRWWRIPWTAEGAARVVIARHRQDFLRLAAASVARRQDGLVGGSIAFRQVQGSADIPLNIEESDLDFDRRGPCLVTIEIDRLDDAAARPQRYECEITLPNPGNGVAYPEVVLKQIPQSPSPRR